MQNILVSYKFLAITLALIIVAHVWASITSAYFFIWWFDILMHFAGGAWVGALAIFLVRRYSFNIFLMLWLVLGLVVIVGVFWELMEFGLNRFGGEMMRRIFYQTNIEDTLGDLVADMLGGLVAFILFKLKKKDI